MFHDMNKSVVILGSIGFSAVIVLALILLFVIMRGQVRINKLQSTPLPEPYHKRYLKYLITTMNIIGWKKFKSRDAMKHIVLANAMNDGSSEMIMHMHDAHKDIEAFIAEHDIMPGHECTVQSYSDFLMQELDKPLETVNAIS